MGPTTTYVPKSATPYVDFINSTVSIDGRVTTGVNQSNEEGPISGVLFPNVQSLYIEDINMIKQPALIHDVVALHAGVGCPLKSFTIYNDGMKRELTGRDES